MIIFTNTITSRLQYISDFIGKEITGKVFHLTTDLNFYLQQEDPKINYSNEHITENEFWIQPHSLLFEKGIEQQTIECFIDNGIKAFFKTSGDLSFDIFATSFYLLSRYEEYLPYQKDIYGRYAHENSLAFKENFLHLPLINLWLQNFKGVLKRKFPSLTIHHSPFTFLPTYDIDEAYSYRHKDWWRSAGGIAKALTKGNWSKINERRKVLLGKMNDPYDCYEWMDDLHHRYNLRPRYFFLVPGKTAKYDKNILPDQPALQQLIRQHAENYSIGVHPSWQSGDDESLIKSEIETIEKITGKKIISSRQHYIRFTLPETFRHLISAGITEDFSMGYGSINGFRASVASTFYWYDLEKERTTELLLHPFCFMDANSFFEQKFSSQEALEEMQHYHRIIKSVNGLFIPIWHNNFLGTEKIYSGWRDVYEKFIKEIS